MGDYTMDKRGDIGSMVREAAMVVILNILKKWVASRRDPVVEKRSLLIISSELVYSLVCLVLQ